MLGGAPNYYRKERLTRLGELWYVLAVVESSEVSEHLFRVFAYVRTSKRWVVV
jgi:hypothetical protein